MAATRGQRIRARLLHRYRAAQERAHVLARRGWLDRPISALPLIFGEPAVVVRDSFNRNDNAASMGNAETGQPWTAHIDVCGISSGAAYQATPVAGGRATLDSGVSDGIISVLMRTAAPDSGLIFRFVDVDNFFTWRAMAAGFGHRLTRREAGVNNTLFNLAVEVANGDVLEVRMNGSQISVYLNGILRTTETDTFQTTATRHGLYLDDTTARFDDFLMKGL